MSKTFCHIHNHTEYSLLDGANRIPDMVKRAKEMEMSSLAISDHGVMFGVMEFYLECKKAAIKPLLGVEAYVAPQGIDQKKGDGEKNAYHLLLLAKDLEGYRNLCRLSTIAALEGYYYKPRVDHEILRAHSKGVIATSACLGSEVCQELLKGNYDRAQYIAGMYDEMYGHGNFFIELQDHRLPEQGRITPDLIRIAKELKLPLVATNDAHYLCKGDAQPHDVLLCIQTGALVADEKRFKFATDEFYLKSQVEMGEIFKEYPEALENTAMIAEMCNVELDKQRAPMPEPQVPEGMESFAYLRDLAEKGLSARMKDPEASLTRLEYELEVIKKTGFGDYFLLVREFANEARRKGIHYGVRGSAAGSLVSYCVGITDVDPVEYGLTFERFLNPERISMPDVDMDFEDTRREEIIQYVTERFGRDRVAQIVTFGTLGAKAAIKDCGRVQGYTPQETDRLTKTIPTLPGWSLKRAYSEIAEFRQIVDGDPRMKSLFETAKTVEGIARNSGVHAAGVVISRDPLVDYIPLYRGNDGQAITAFEMGILEKIGMLKMDFLGLSNLTVLGGTIAKIKQTQGIDFDISTIPEDDAKTFDMLARGETTGVFQLEGGGMTRYVQQLKPASIRELAAMIALYRPGPMEHIPRFIDTKFGRQKAVYLDERMKPILEETYGVIVYQDQVMQVVQAIAGFSLGKADVLRRAMGKKDAKAMADMKVEFIEGTAAAGISEKVAEEVWQLLLPFAGYAFNKAHAVCYAILSYQTGYLKANFPTEYMAALLSVYLSKEDRVAACIEECRRLKIQVLQPDVNASLGDFNIEGGTGGPPVRISGGSPEKKSKSAPNSIRFGLTAIKGVGEGVVEGIIKEREENGPYRHLYEFCDRTKPFGLNRTALEALVRAGALDSIDPNRRKLLNHVDGALQFADQQLKERLSTQSSFEFLVDSGPAHTSYPTLPECDMPSRGDNLSMEKEVMGIYVSDHPLRGHERTILQNGSHTCAAALELDDSHPVKLAGVIAKLRTIVTKAEGKKMASLVLEDFTGQVGAIAFPATFEKLRESLVKDSVVQITGFMMHREMRGEKSVEVRIEDIKPLEASLLPVDGPSRAAGKVSLTIWRATEREMFNLRRLIEEHPGDYELFIQIMVGSTPQMLPVPHHVNPTQTFCTAICEGLTRAELDVTHSQGPGTIH
ncbi:DNA polymerase III subunit alpha [Fimbriimonas ginsengisoli]|uniref:DNA polymerase III subunit alpha n=1 Tax=Fimbriimonas ginsengisoli Gsoil 348 TaxID=661478 RepID=A0A068NWN7_FIMGI|nr:DNA polymerase III subunit alpha [Fimbriimonas ginsengisoli]AIE87180.1 DNA polymerase III DnaE [Fimbriimonas ginsengisoli Gsoil 348]